MSVVILPEHSKRVQNHTLKYCQEPGCGKEYVGHPITKYCAFHRILGNRARKKVTYKPITEDNFVFEHNFTESTIVRRNCACCGAEYEILVIPRQKVYSKYCAEHTNSYKRELYQKAKN